MDDHILIGDVVHNARSNSTRICFDVDRFEWIFHLNILEDNIADTLYCCSGRYRADTHSHTVDHINVSNIDVVTAIPPIAIAIARFHDYSIIEILNGAVLNKYIIAANIDSICIQRESRNTTKAINSSLRLFLTRILKPHVVLFQYLLLPFAIHKDVDVVNMQSMHIVDSAVKFRRILKPQPIDLHIYKG
jgi:hypothetical protein